MKRTSETAVHIAEKSEILYDASRNITNAVNLITKLAKKTSLLALNAAIEAARAKEKGKSFTVMASEIRSMASKANNQAQQIKSIVETIQEKVNSIREGILKVKEEMEDASLRSSKSSNIMREIVNEMGNFTENVDRVVKSIKRVVEEIEVLHQGAETIAAAAEESASAVAQVTNTIEAQVQAFSNVEELSEKIKNYIQAIEGDGKNISSNNIVQKISKELMTSIEELDMSMEQIVEALEQIEQASEISKNDALKNFQVSERCVNYIKDSQEIVKNMKSSMSEIYQKFDLLIKELEIVKQKAEENSKMAEDQKTELNFVKSKINSLNNTIRKIELAIVQTAALSISGAVEAIRIGELGEGFSEVSNDIRDLATTSEENLDRVIEIIDKVQEENDIIAVEINNIILTQERENERIHKVENEIKRNLENLKNVKDKVEAFLSSIEEMLTALEESKIASEQIKEAAQLSYKNVSESKDAATLILTTTKEMKTFVEAIDEFLNK